MSTKILIEQYKKSCLEENGIQSLKTAFIDKNVVSELRYRPEFLTNDFKSKIRVLSSIENELINCDEFLISVAFITMGGITPLLEALKELEIDGKKGKILTTDYLNFSEPKAIEKLHNFSNIEIKMYSTEGEDGFHTKGYIFRKDEIYTIIVGSSNMTQNALTKNKEWNTKVVTSEDGEYTEKIMEDFNQMWNSQRAKSFEEFYELYKEKYELIKQRNKEVEELIKEQFPAVQNLKPNNMQIKFVENCNKLIDEGKKRALLISATGTGKTYASAFLMRENNPGRVLFLVHRDMILRQAKKSYMKVIENKKKFAILSGNPDPDYEKADYLFSTMNMMAKDEVREKFDPCYFDMIVIDEVHRAGAESYKKIINYFKPNFYLGMTASPETLNGEFNVYDLFDNNIAYEIRLQKAMEEDMLCPFHYFGIADFEVDGKVFDDENVKNFNRLVDDNRVDHIIKQINYYGYSGNRAKGLIFCFSVKEAEVLSRKFNERGYRTEALSGEDSPEKRQDAINRLISDDRDKYLDYIFTRDIFNEGVDIPEINQVIMLRPTESPVVFVQQLGRGLRKADKKEYVVILDFIGNYQNNFMIPMALSGDRSYNKDRARKHVQGENIVGSSTIHFDKITRSRVYASIDRMNATKRVLTENYVNLKNKLGRIPLLFDFYEHGEIDPLIIINHNKSYNDFLHSISRVEKEYKVDFDEYEEDVLRFLSQYLTNGKRVYELEILNDLVENSICNITELSNRLQKYEKPASEKDIESAYHYLKGNFCNGNDFQCCSDLGIIEKEENDFLIGKKFKDHLRNQSFKEQIVDILKTGFAIYLDEYNNDIDRLGFSLYKKYSRRDVCRILNWEKNEESVIYGYRIKYNSCPIFVTYEKEEDIDASVNYGDRIDSNKIFSWYTRNRVDINHPEVVAISESEKTGLKLPLFIKKNNDEGSDFYYMGEVKPIDKVQKTIKDKKGKTLPIVLFTFEMKNEIRNDIYEYIKYQEVIKE